MCVDDVICSISGSTTLSLIIPSPAATTGHSCEQANDITHSIHLITFKPFPNFDALKAPVSWCSCAQLPLQSVDFNYVCFQVARLQNRWMSHHDVIQCDFVAHRWWMQHDKIMILMDFAIKFWCCFSLDPINSSRKSIWYSIRTCHA